jgi:hypothetical protein
LPKATAHKFAPPCKRWIKLRVAKCQWQHQPSLLLPLLPLLSTHRKRLSRQLLKLLQQKPPKPVLQKQPKRLLPLRPPPKLHRVLWLPCVVMTDLVKSAPKLRLLGVVVMASPVAASLATALVATKALGLAVTVTALPRAVLVWAMRRSVRNALLWSRRKTHCVAWPLKRMAKS